MSDSNYPRALDSREVAPRAQKSYYPEPFAQKMEGREKRILGDLFGLKNFGVNLTKLLPSAASALHHTHTTQDEFIYILQGNPTLITDEGEQQLSPGMCAGFRAGSANAHHLVNNTNEEVIYLEIGDRTPGDTVTYPDDDLLAMLVDGKWHFTHKDSQPY